MTLLVLFKFGENVTLVLSSQWVFVIIVIS